MEFKELVKGVKIPVLGLGTWGMGGKSSPDTSHDKESIEALKRGIELGITHIDTAELYADGHAEEVVGEAIKSFDREKIFVTTKVKPDNLRYNDLINAAKRSLKRLQIEQMDLYLVHWPNQNIPLKETMRGMEYLLEQELTRFIGVSNFSAKLMKEAQSYLTGENRIVANQVEFSLMHKDPEKDILPFCQKEKIMLIAYSPLARGAIAKGGIKLVNELSKTYNKTPTQIALNWLISKEQVIAIPKASNVKHVEENAGAVGWRLNDNAIGKLDGIS